MVDLTITEVNVDAGTDGEIGTGVAGAAITAGKLILNPQSIRFEQRFPV